MCMSPCQLIFPHHVNPIVSLHKEDPIIIKDCDDDPRPLYLTFVDSDVQWEWVIK